MGGPKLDFEQRQRASALVERIVADDDPDAVAFEIIDLRDRLADWERLAKAQTARLDKIGDITARNGELNWRGLVDVVEAYVTDTKPEGWTDSPRAIVLAAIERLRSAGAGLQGDV